MAVKRLVKHDFASPGGQGLVLKKPTSLRATSAALEQAKDDPWIRTS